MSKMKVIQKVVKKLSREQESAGGGCSGGGGGVRTGTKTLKSPLVFQGDLIIGQLAPMSVYTSIPHNRRPVR